MKYFNVITFCLLILSGCQQNSGTGFSITEKEEPKSAASDSGGTSSTLNTYSVVLTLDNTAAISASFTLSLFCDLDTVSEQQIVIVPTTLAAGQTLTYGCNAGTIAARANNTGQSGVTMSNASVMWIKLYKNGTLVHQAALTSAGTSTTFPNL